MAKGHKFIKSLGMVNEKKEQNHFEGMDDDEVLKMSLKDPAYFSILVKKYEEPFMRAAVSITRSREEAEDIIQEAFSKIYANGAKFKREPGATFKSWAYKILINTSFTHYQKLKKNTGNVAYLDPVLYDDDEKFAEGSDISESSDHKAIITKTLDKMPEHLGRLLKMYYLEDKSYNDIALAEGISTTTLKMRLFRAKRLFKKLMLEE